VLANRGGQTKGGLRLPELLRLDRPPFGVVSTSSMSGSIVPEPYDPSGGVFLGVTLLLFGVASSGFRVWSCKLSSPPIASGGEQGRIACNGGDGVGLGGYTV